MIGTATVPASVVSLVGVRPFIPLIALRPFIPLAIAGLLALPILLAIGIDRVDRVLRRISVVAFGSYVDRSERKKASRQHRLRAAQFPTTYRAYASTTILYSMVGALVGGILGLYVVWGALKILAIDQERMRALLPTALAPLSNFAGLGTLTPMELLTVMLASGLTFGLLAGLLTYVFRWWWPGHVAATRMRSIEATMPQAIAFMYALSRSGMSFTKVLSIMAAHRRIYGATAAEVDVAVRQMDLFGRDMITAIQRMGRRTPSEQFQEFAENLASVLQSGRNLAGFLDDQYDDFQEEAEAQQEQLLNLISTLAEAYVTVLVAGPLFLITILVIIGIAGANTLTPLQVFVYFLIPIGNLGFILYLDTVTARFGRGERIESLPAVATGLHDIRRATGDGSSTRGPTAGELGAGGAGTGTSTAAGGRDARTDGGYAGDADRQRANLERLAVHRRIEWLRDRIGAPGRTVVQRPITLLYVTVPIAVFGTLFRLATAGQLTVDVVDDMFIQATLFVVATFAMVFEIHRRRIETIEAAVPDFLDRLASVNEAGLSMIDSIGRVRASDLGALGPEVDRIWADIQWGSDIERALKRFERRVRTRTISRVVALITNAMNASGDVSRVLRIAAAQAKADRRLKRQRKQEMLAYVVVVYVSFGVFLVIIAALDAVLIPNLPEQAITPGGGNPNQPSVTPGMGQLEGLGTIDAEAYTLLFFHTALLQALLSGIVAGQMSSGDIRDGAKHAAILMSVAYMAFLVI
ncbi:archaeal flagella assembly protein J [Salinarchaeum sp. Harcht-Bsk1]|uniref:type II secretion system F family protein n=1 Tax=Salinarchaeum sp. Harcht-Bsk1 TaxID=1333523 RepID=UPI0003422BF4|nr:type II secretion system F family protein [Salinarchaeum sp. Harcht-Bsk1]AGN02609.1 archaeal flagella assembly protein J [Salinarchaeum sp. Harcht-Bsk1]